MSDLLRRYLPNEAQHLFALTLVVGIVCGSVAVAFHLAIRGAESLLVERAIHATGSSWMVWLVVTPMLGGLVAGAVLIWIPGARGSGIPQVKQAFAVEGGRVKVRDALGKFVIGTLQIGSGSSLGREGPTVQICAGATSLLARATSLPPRNMRRLLPVGVAAGIAAAFNAPIAAVTFTIEEIVGTLDHAILSGVVVAAALAAVIERGILGVHPVIEVAQAYSLDHPSSLAVYALLGGAAAVASVVFTDSLLGLRSWFRRVRFVPEWMRPSVGGLVTGILAVLMLRFLGTGGVTGGGYETLGHALDGQLGLRVLLLLCVAKIAATAFSYSSGGAGGIFAPALFIGAMLGGAFGHLDVVALGHEPRQLGAFALVGMGAVFAGVIRAPMTSVLIIFEMTGGYGLVLPLMLANMTAYIIARHWRPKSIYEALLEQDGIFLPEPATRKHALEQLSVADAMTVDVVTARPADSILDTGARLASRSFASLPVVDDQGAVLGVVAMEQLRRAAEPAQPVSALAKRADVIRKNATLLEAIVQMDNLGVRRLLVVDDISRPRLLGILAMSDLVRAHARAAFPTNSHGNAATMPPALFIDAQSLMSPAVLVAAAASAGELSMLLHSSRAKALLLRDGDTFAAILPEDLHTFAGDDGLQRLLVAADLARAVPCLEDSAEIGVLIREFATSDAAVVIMLDGTSGEPVGVVTRESLSLSLLRWCAQQPALLAGMRRQQAGSDAASAGE